MSSSSLLGLWSASDWWVGLCSCSNSLNCSLQDSELPLTSDESLLSTKEPLQRLSLPSAVGRFYLQNLSLTRAPFCDCEMTAWLPSHLWNTVTLVSDAASSDLETHWTKNVYNLFFPLIFSFLYWFSIFSTRLITSKIPIYIQILLNSASYITWNFFVHKPIF